MSELATLHRNLVAIRTTRRQVEKLLDNAAKILEESRVEERRIRQRIETKILENAMDFPSVIGVEEKQTI